METPWLLEPEVQWLGLECWTSSIHQDQRWELVLMTMVGTAPAVIDDNGLKSQQWRLIMP